MIFRSSAGKYKSKNTFDNNLLSGKDFYENIYRNYENYVELRSDTSIIFFLPKLDFWPLTLEFLIDILRSG